MRTSLIIGLLLTSLVAGCQDIVGSGEIRGPQCVRSAGDGFYSDAMSAAKDETKGFVSFTRQMADDTGTSRETHFSLDCATGKGVSLSRYSVPSVDRTTGEEKRELETPPQISRFDVDFVEAVAVLRSEGYLTDLSKLSKVARPAGFELTLLTADAASETAICACKLYYPKATGDWATTKMTDAAASN